MSPPLIIVGEDYGNTDESYHKDVFALTGLSGVRLAYMAGMTRTRFFSLTERTNVVDCPDDWRDPVKVAAGVARVKTRLAGRRALLLGSKVSSALGVGDVPMFEWHEVDGATLARVPHPSGRNRVLNSSHVRDKMSTFLKEALR